MTERISFEKELNALRKAGFTEQQVKAIWKLALRLSVTIADKIYINGGIKLEEEDESQTDCPGK